MKNSLVAITLVCFTSCISRDLSVIKFSLFEDCFSFHKVNYCINFEIDSTYTRIDQSLGFTSGSIKSYNFFNDFDTISIGIYLEPLGANSQVDTLLSDRLKKEVKDKFTSIYSCEVSSYSREKYYFDGILTVGSDPRFNVIQYSGYNYNHNTNAIGVFVNSISKPGSKAPLININKIIQTIKVSRSKSYRPLPRQDKQCRIKVF